MSTEHVQLLDEDGRAAGTADKAEVHHASTPLHLAFSCYLFDADGRTLLTQRGLEKKTWPGAWTNTCCGHPAPGEPIATAVRRRVRQELGVEIDDLLLLLPTFRYRAEMDDGTLENEMCPVFAGTLRGELVPDPYEVNDVRWRPWADVRAEVEAGTSTLSPWALSQIRALPQHPVSAPPQPETDLPPAARDHTAT